MVVDTVDDMNDSSWNKPWDELINTASELLETAVFKSLFAEGNSKDPWHPLPLLIFCMKSLWPCEILFFFPLPLWLICGSTHGLSGVWNVLCLTERTMRRVEPHQSFSVFFCRICNVSLCRNNRAETRDVRQRCHEKKKLSFCPRFHVCSRNSGLDQSREKWKNLGHPCNVIVPGGYRHRGEAPHMYARRPLCEHMSP